MRHLDRAAVPAPACLARFDAGRDGWKDLTPEDREELRAQLGRLQAERCAYCECDLSRESRRPHLEHFVQRSRDRARMFAWENLFWSCSSPDRCGKHKDRVARTYDPRELLKPDVDDPRRYLFFASDGKVHARAGLDGAALRRAEETIRVFALDHGALVAMRAAYVAGPIGELAQLQELDLTAAEAREYAELVARDHDRHPFSAAILDALGIVP